MEDNNTRLEKIKQAVEAEAGFRGIVQAIVYDINAAFIKAGVLDEDTFFYIQEPDQPELKHLDFEKLIDNRLAITICLASPYSSRISPFNPTIGSHLGVLRVEQFQQDELRVRRHYPSMLQGPDCDCLTCINKAELADQIFECLIEPHVLTFIRVSRETLAEQRRQEKERQDYLLGAENASEE